MESRELSQVAPGGQAGGLTEAETLDRVIKQHNLIRELLRKVLKKGLHYGEIPGTRRKKDEGEDDPEKNVLFKPGAEKISFLFQMVPTFEFVQRDTEGDHREYEATCTLKIRGTDIVVGQGVGVCSTLESKYRYRWDNTHQPVPAEYWETRDLSIIGGDSFAARKAWVDGTQSWFVFRKVEHADPADYYNTVKKIAKKRAYVDGCITATACGDLFTQDVIDEGDDDTYVDPAEGTGHAAQPAAGGGAKPPQRKSANGGGQAAPPTGGNVWRGQVKSCSIKKQGTTKDRKTGNEKPYTIYAITGADGKVFETFSDSHAELASSVASNGGEVEIHFERDAYGLKVKSMDPVMPAAEREPGSGG